MYKHYLINSSKTILFLLVFYSLTILLSGCAQVTSPVAVPAVPPPATKLPFQPRVALVLGSGGARGYAHLGVLQALEEAHIPVDLIAGSSAGSIIATLYADNGSAKKTLDIMMGASFWDFADITSVTSFGLVHGTNLQYFLLRHMHAKNFEELIKKTMIVATDVNSGQAYTIQSGPIAPAVLASSALPGLVKPVKLYGHLLVDGGITDPVPVDLVTPFHPKIIIAVNISKKVNAYQPTSAYAVYNTAYDIMWQHLTKHSLNGADIVIHPDAGDSTFDLKKRQEMYLSGLNEGRKAIPAIKRLLAEKNIMV